MFPIFGGGGSLAVVLVPGHQVVDRLAHVWELLFPIFGGGGSLAVVLVPGHQAVDRLAHL